MMTDTYGDHIVGPLPGDTPPEGQPVIERILDGGWGVDTLVDNFKHAVETAARLAGEGRPRRVRVYVEET